MWTIKYNVANNEGRHEEYKGPLSTSPRSNFKVKRFSIIENEQSNMEKECTFKARAKSLVRANHNLNQTVTFSSRNNFGSFDTNLNTTANEGKFEAFKLSSF